MHLFSYKYILEYNLRRRRAIALSARVVGDKRERGKRAWMRIGRGGRMGSKEIYNYVLICHLRRRGAIVLSVRVVGVLLMVVLLICAVEHC